MYESPPVIAETATILQQRLSLEIESLETQAIELDALRYSIAKATTEHLKLLYEKRAQMLWPKDVDKSLTELDRRTRLDGDTAIIEADYVLLTKIDNLVESRLGLIMVLLNR